MKPKSLLRAIKIFHTIVWAFFAICIILIPILGFFRNYNLVALLIGIVFIEVLILVLNGWHCPLTGWAAKYTTDTNSDNFDIYLPNWLAKHNMLIFGILFFGGILFSLTRWAGWFD